MQNPKVSVVLSSYNHSDFIAEAIESVLNQSYKDFRLIIWDDASSDESWDVICRYLDPRIYKIQNSANKTKLFNDFLKSNLNNSEFIAIHHSDDIWEPEKLEKQVAFLNGHSEFGAVFTHVTPIDQTGQPLRDASHPYYSVFDQTNRNRHEWLRFFFLGHNVLCHPSILIRAACYDQCGLYNHALIQLPDFDMWVRLVMHYEIHVLPEKLVQFRIMDDEKNTSGNRKDARIRSYLENYQVLTNYRELSEMKELIKVIPEAAMYDKGIHSDVLYALAQCGLQLTEKPHVQLFCYNLLFEAMNDIHRRSNLEKTYGFTIHDFKEISSDLDVFAYEEKTILQSQNNSLNEQIRVLTLDYERVQSQISLLNQEMEAGVLKNINLQNQLDSITQSKSWKIIHFFQTLINKKKP